MSKAEKLTEYEYDKVPVEDLFPDKEKKSPKYGYGVRHIQLLIFFLCLTVNIIGRGHMGVTIVAMTSNANESVLNTIPRRINTTVNINGSENITDNVIDGVISNISEIEMNSLGNTTKTTHITYNWPKSVQEMVLSAFFLGYAIMMFPMGMICQRFGGKLPLQISLFVNAIVSMATPWLAIWGGWKAVCCCRILQGLSQAGTYPCIQALLAKWVPANERASLGSCVYNGLAIGTIVAFQVGGFLGASRWSWPSTFYAVGVISLLCLIVLTIFGVATPLEHKSISEEERKYIMEAGNSGMGQTLKTPWRGILTSRPFWGTLITHVGSTTAFVFFFTQVPSYIHHILGVNVRNSGMLSSLPFVASFFTTLGFGWISDYCINNNILSMTNARRICNSIANVGLAILLVLTSYTNNTAVAVICLVVGLGANVGIHSGWMVNYIDLAPNFSGTLTATGNTVANICVTLSPIVVANIITDTTNLIQWRIMFFIVAGVAITTNAVFVFLASTDIQPWNYAKEKETCNEKNLKKETHVP